MKKIGNISNIPIVQGMNNEIKNQIKAEINIDGTLSFKKRNSLSELTPLTYIDVQGNNTKSRRKVGELFNKPLISSPTRLLKKKEILVQKSNEGIILSIKVNNDIKIISKQVEGGVTPEPEPEKDYLCFTSTGDSTVAMTQEGTPNTSANKVIQYKINNGEWQTWDLLAVSLADGDKMYLKSDDDIPISESSYVYKKFVMDGSIAASGNIMSLLNFSTTLTNNAFINLFEQCKALTQAPELPATTLAEKCYYYMFSGCSALTTAPELPATTLANRCYYDMFEGCSSLTQAPELPATTLADSCYGYMFAGCTKLNYVKAMFITNQRLGTYLQQWLDNVSSTGTFVKSTNATWSNTDAGIPSGWTVETV